jgi:3D (Asp-Asp-Asp) domain-containing protein
MKLFGLLGGFELTKDKVMASISVLSIVALCSLSGIGISALLEADAAAERNKREQAVADLIDETSSTEESTEPEETDPTETDPTETMSSESSTSETDITTETSDTSATETTKETTKETVGERSFKAAVYATKVVNLRKGPGTEYEVIRQLRRGDRIDVIAVTTNGWYKTYKGNYISIEFTQTDPIATNTPTPKPTKKPTKAPTKKPTTKPTKKPTNKPTPSASEKTYVGEFKITFYIPFQGTKTASGTTCTMGRTIAANKSDFAFGTVVYIENDPLKGDGLYTVEDRGVSAGKIDIFVNSMSDVPSYGRTTRKVYLVSKK